MEDSIHKTMLKEHKKILGVVDMLEREIDDYEKTLANFNKLRWNLKKHFFVEEHAIFDMFINIYGEETAQIFNLLQDHSRITGLMNEIEWKLKRKIRPSVRMLKEILAEHKRLENKNFYPKLDERFEDAKKLELLKRIREIIP